MTALRTLAFLALLGVSSSQTSNCSYLGLLTHLNVTTSNDLLKITRPVKNWTSTTNVQLEMSLFGILDVDEKSQTVSLHVSIHKFWENEFLKWNSSEFCGINALTIPRTMLWIPDIAIHEDSSDVGSVQEGPHAKLDPSGLVHVRRHQRLTFSCQLDLFRFPFDVQNCNITFSSMSLDETFIKLIEIEKSNSMLPDQFMRTQGEWKLLDQKVLTYTSYRSNTTRSRLVYTVMLQRKPFLYVINLILPLMFLLVLDMASFFVSEARGEKLGFKVTVLLSIFVLLLILQDILPSTEENMPMIAIYCLSVFTLVWISVLEAMLIGFIIDLDGSCGQKSQSSKDAEADIELEVNSHNEPAAENQVKGEKRNLHVDRPGDTMKRIQDNGNAQKPGSGDKAERKAPNYRKLAKIMDIVFFVFYCLIVVTFHICSFVIWMEDVRKHGL